jgi:cysteine desulfurase family protein (TIGR01976 family)
MSETTAAHPTLPPIELVRSQFPGLRDDEAALDGAAGTKVPQAVIDAVSEALVSAMANTHGVFAASRQTDQVVLAARQALADLLGGDPSGVILGPNMTTLTFHVADTLAREWRAGDEIVVSSLDHDANVRPWVLAAQRAGASVRFAEVDPQTSELPAEAVAAVLSERTRLVAVTAASNLIGTKPDIPAITALAHQAGALTYIDGVHATAHGPVDVAALGADFYACSTYKFCGPHTGCVIAAPELLERLSPAKLLPSPTEVPDRFERGTPAFELLAGVSAAVDWLAALADGADASASAGTRRERLHRSFEAVEAHTQSLLGRLLKGLDAIEKVELIGAPRRRASTVAFTVRGQHPQRVAEHLAARGVSVWHGDNYALELVRRLGRDSSGGVVRASIVLYNTQAEIDRLLEAAAEL